jgi:hypothetical protein
MTSNQAKTGREAAKKKPMRGRRQKTLSAAHRAAIAAALRGRKRSEATKAKIRTTCRSEAVREKMRAAHRGKPLSAANRAALSRAMRAKCRSAAYRAQISDRLKGRVVSAATRAKISAGLRGTRSSSYRHGFYARPETPIETPADLIGVLIEQRARLSALLDQPPISPADYAHLGELYGITVGRLVRLLRDEWQDQADEEAAQAQIGDLEEILAEMEKEEGKEK